MIIEINSQSPQPLYEQLGEQVIFGIAAGLLQPGEALPSVRRLAADLGINFHTVNKAYAQLSDAGYIVMDRRRGAVVASEINSDAEFTAELAHSLAFNAAKAICVRISEQDFLALCQESFRQVKGDMPQ